MKAMLKIFIASILLHSAAAHANTELKLGNLGPWKMTVLQTRSELFNEAEVALSLPQGPGEYTPTVFAEKLPVVAKPESKAEWHHLMFLNVKKPVVVMNERMFKVGDQFRYIVEFQSHAGADTALNSVVMAVSLNGEIFVFSYSNHRRTFNRFIPDIRELMRTLDIGLIQATRP